MEKSTQKLAKRAAYQAPRISLRAVTMMPLCVSEGSVINPYTETEFDWN